MKKPPAKGKKPSVKKETKPKLNGDGFELVQVKRSWEGPLPSPETLKQFNDIVENGAERIFSAWEGETAHRHKLESRDLGWSIFEAIFGKTLAFVYIIVTLGLSAYVLSLGAVWLSAIFGIGTIVSVVLAFIKTNRDSNNKKK